MVYKDKYDREVKSGMTLRHNDGDLKKVECVKEDEPEQPKKIILDEDGENWICLCGNQAHLTGFFPCNAKGEEVELDERWNGLYYCDECKIIIDQSTLEIIGKR